MSRDTLLIILGIVIALSPYLGLPLWLLGIVLPVLGLAIIGLGLSARSRVKRVRDTKSGPSYEVAEA